jgi:phenylacetate-CoA ligase
MGIWIAGTFTARIGMQLAQEGWHITTVTPGPDPAALEGVLTQVAPRFAHVILAGFPSYIGKVVREQHTLIKKSKARYKILLAAEQISEAFRDELLAYVGSAKASDVISIYGSADAGVMGFETPTTIALRRASEKNLGIREKLFGVGDNGAVPALYQYLSSYIYFETSGKELILTTRSASPLLRYKIHDVGEVIPARTIQSLAQGLENSLPTKLTQLPAISYRSRTDVAILYHAINLTSTQLSAWYLPKLQRVIEGYIVYTEKVSASIGERLHFTLATNTVLSKSDRKRIVTAIHKALLNHSIEYRKVCEVFGLHAYPRVVFTRSTTQLQLPAKTRGLLHLNGKKARIITS